MAAKGLSLHVGLNFVDPRHYGGWDGELVACEQDANDMAALAESRGFRSTTLLTADATVAAVSAGIAQAAGQLRAYDTFLLTYSGHGGQVPDRNRDESTTSPGEIGEAGDPYDETWVLWDRMMVDDELWALFAQFQPGVRVVVLSDSCHSGTVARLAPDPVARARKARRIPTRVEIGVYDAHRDLYDGVQAKVPARSGDLIGASVILISGCQDNQLSYDGPVNGLFTGTLLRVWDQGRFKGTLYRLRARISSEMPPEQTPNYYITGRYSRSFLERQAFRI